MTWCYIIYAAVLCGTPLSLTDNVRLQKTFQKYYLSLLVVLLIAFCAFRLAGPSRDFESYLIWFNTIISGEATPFLKSKDPAFLFISSISEAIGAGFFGVLLVYALITISVQAYFAKLAFSPRYLTLFFYLIFCRLFILQDYTQIRAAAAAALMSVSIVLACESKRRAALLIYIVALLFHISAILALPLLIVALSPTKLTSRMWVFLLIPFAVAIRLGQDRIAALGMGFARVASYMGDRDFGGPDLHVINLLSFAFLLRASFLIIVISFYWSKASRLERLAVLGAGMGLFYFVAFSSFAQGMAIRSSELFALFELVVFLIPLGRMNWGFRLVYALCGIILAFTYYHTTLLLLPGYGIG